MSSRKELEAPQEQTFGKRLAALRKAAGYSQRDLGQELGISQRMVAYYEGQTDRPPAALLPKIAEILGIGTDELLGFKSPKKTGPKASRHIWRRLKAIEQLPAKDRRQLLALIDAFLDRHRLEQKDRA